LQKTHMHPCAYLLRNVPPLGDCGPFAILARWQHIKVWITELMQMDVVSIGS
jgi:hypothetical protein